MSRNARFARPVSAIPAVLLLAACSDSPTAPDAQPSDVMAQVELCPSSSCSMYGYKIKYIGSLGGLHSNASDINDAGVVVGTSQTNSGKSHAFHRHPNQEEVIYVLSGELEQWVEDERRTLCAGDAVVIPAAVVHASYNVSDEEAKIIAILSPCVGEAGYEVEELASVEPWRSMRGSA